MHVCFVPESCEPEIEETAWSSSAGTIQPHERDSAVITAQDRCESKVTEEYMQHSEQSM